MPRVFSMDLSLLVALLFSCAVATLANPTAGAHAARHDAHKRVAFSLAQSNLTARSEGSHTLEKRFDNARWTFYSTGLGACGGFNNDGDFIVALNSQQYGGGEHCYNTISMSYNGKTATAQIVDECPGCPFGGLDLSPGLFSHFASQDLGVISGTWNFGGNSNPAPPPPPAPKPAPSSHNNPPPPSTTHESTSTVTTTSTSTSTKTSTSTQTVTSTSTATVAPTIGASENFIDAIYCAVNQLGGVIAAGSGQKQELLVPL